MNNDRRDLPSKTRAGEWAALLLPAAVPLALAKGGVWHWLIATCLLGVLCLRLRAEFRRAYDSGTPWPVFRVALRRSILGTWCAGWALSSAARLASLTVAAIHPLSTTLDMLAWEIVAIAATGAVVLALPAKRHPTLLLPMGIAAVQRALVYDFESPVPALLSAAGALVVVAGVYWASGRFARPGRAGILLTSGAGLVALACGWPMIGTMAVYPEYAGLVMMGLLLPLAFVALWRATGGKWLERPAARVALATLVTLGVCAPVFLLTPQWKPGNTDHCAGGHLRVVVDTDMSYDDIVTLLYLLRHPDVEVVAITTVTGVGDAAGGAVTARRLVALSGCNVPVIAGASHPLEGDREVPLLWKHAATVALRPVLPPAAAESPGSAGEVLQAALADGNLVLALGPLTNIANALEDGTAGGGLIVISAGLIDKDKAGPGITDWNLWLDPEAAEKVIATAPNIALVPLDTTNLALFDAGVIASLGERADTQGERIALRVLRALESGSPHGVAVWDAVAAAVAIDDAVCTEWQVMTLAVDPSGDDAGRVRLVAEGSRAAVCWKVDTAAMVSALAENVSLED